MKITEDFKRIIDEDIARCEEEIKTGNKDSNGKLHGILLSKYNPIINGFEDGLLSLFYDSNGAYRRENLEYMKEKLILFKAMDYKNFNEKDDEAKITINNSNEVTTNINVTFEDVKRQVENMTSLRDEDIEEIHSKIDEIERIINSSERKTKKWEMAKEIVKWVADKGVDVAIALLPLILKIGE